MFVCPRSVTESSLGDGKFFFSTTTYGGAYVVVVMFVCLFFVCPRNYLNNVQDIIKVHFCQLRLVVSFNNILYTHARIAQASHHATLGRGAMGTYGVHDPSRYRPFPSSKSIFFCFLSNKREERDYLLSLVVLLYVELLSVGTPPPHRPHTHARRHHKPRHSPHHATLWEGGDGDVRRTSTRHIPAAPALDRPLFPHYSDFLFSVIFSVFFPFQLFACLGVSNIVFPIFSVLPFFSFFSEIIP